MSSYHIDITDHGAVGDGKTLNTEAIQKALDAIAAAGGGTVFVPPGTYLTGTIKVHSLTTLELHPAARILGSSDLDDYEAKSWGQHIDRTPWHLLLLDGVHDVTITGGGTIDGNGPSFWEDTVAGPYADGDAAVVPGAFNAINAITAVAARHADAPDRSPIAWIRANKEKRPSPMVEVTDCKDIRIQNVHLTNSAGWTLHLHNSQHIWISGVKLTSNLMGPNNDGFDITGCQDVMVSDSSLSCCDDAIVLKTTPDSRAIERVTVTNCILRTPCVALKFGTSESYQDFRNVTFSNCVVYESTRAIGLYTKHGGNIDNVAISNIVCDTRMAFAMNRPIHLMAQKPSEESGLPTGKIRNVHISGVIMETDGRLLLSADEPGQIEDVVMRDIQVRYPCMDDPMKLEGEVKAGQFPADHPDVAYGYGVLMAKNIDRLIVDNLVVKWPEVDADGKIVVPEEWNFPIKACNGKFDVFFPREEFASDVVLPYPLVNGIGLRGGYVSAPASEAGGGGERFVFGEGCTIAVRE